MRKRLLSLFLALVMVLGMLPVAAFADTSYTIETGDTYAPNNYLGVITQCVVDGAKVLNCKVEESGTKWTLTLPADTDLTAELSYTLTTNIFNKPDRNNRINVSFNGGEYTGVNSSDSTISFSGVPAWDNGEAKVTFATRYQTSTKDDRNRAYTLHLKLDDGVNDPPYLSGDAAASNNMRVNETYSVDLATIFADPDNMSLSYQVSVNGGEAAAAEASYSYVPTEAGTYTLVFTASDGESTSQEYTVTLNVRDNAAPVLAGDATLSAEGMHGLAWNIDLSKLFTDADGDPLTYTVAVNEEAAAAATASYSYTPAATGTYTLVFKAADPKGAESPAYTVTLEAAANPAPTLAGEAAATASVDQYKAWTYDLSTIFSDNEGDALTYTVTVNGAAAVAANTSYSYTANTEGEQTFVFVATDKAGNTSPEHTVTLTVNYVSRTTIKTGCVKHAGNYDGWLDSVTVTGPEITAYEWVGGGSGHDETSDEAHTLNIQLADTVADDAVIAMAYALGGSTGQTKYSSTPPASVTLVDGQATVKLTTQAKNIASWVTTRNYTINFTNKTNTPPEATSEFVTTDVLAGEAYNIDLSQYFTDADGDALTYKVSINGAEDVAADVAYTYTPTTLGEHVLVFKANDVWSDSTKNLIVTLNVANSETTYDVSVTAPEGYSLTFQAVSAVENGTPVIAGDLAYADGVVKVPTNTTMITWSADSAVSGTAQVSAGTALNIQVLTLSAKAASSAADADAVIKVTDANGAVATVGANGIALVAAGSGYTYHAAPSATYNSGSWNGVTLTEQTVSEDASVEMVYTVKGEKTITVPVEASVLVYLHTQNFAGSKVSPVYTTTNEEDGTVTYHYACTQTQSGLRKYVYRATYPGKITKAGYMNVVNDVTLTWTAEDPAPSYRGSAGIPNYYDADAKSTERRNGDGVYLTLNSTGHLNLPRGSKDIGAYRIWNIIDSDTTNVSIEPDYHFNVVAGDDVVKITDKGSAFGNNWQNLSPNGSGTAFVEVTYDALHIETGWPEGGYSSALGHMHDYTYNAIDPNATGMIVVQTDGNAASDVTFRIASDRVQFTRAWDAEHDTYYITENTGSLTLAPTASSGIRSVAVSNDKGNTFTELEAADGAYTATVVPGNNIFCVTNGSGQTAYQVVRVLKLDISLQNKTDESKGAEFAPGDTVRVYMEGLINPCLKMGGIYNPGKVKGSFVGSDGQTYDIQSPSTSWTSGYIFNGNKLYIDVVIPESGQLTLNGNELFVGGTITLGKHRSLTMAGVGSADMTTSNGYCSVLPVIVLGEEETDTAYTDAVILAEELTGEKTVEGNVVTLSASGTIAYAQAQGVGEWGNWVGFKVTAPEGVDMTKVTILRPDGETRNMYDIKDGENFAYLYWNMGAAESDQATYQIDWNSDATYDLSVVLDVSGATLEAAPVTARPELTGEDTIEVSMRLGQWKDLELSEYFTDEDSETLTYYILEDGATEWTALTGSFYRYYPAADGAQITCFIALDESMTLEDLGEETAVLNLVADVAEVPSEVTITFTVSQGPDKYHRTEGGGITMASRELTVPYFDLANYDMADMYYNPRIYVSAESNKMFTNGQAGTREQAEGVVTTLHAFIYATEVFQLGMDAEYLGTGVSYEENLLQQYLTVLDRSPGSAFMNLWNGSNMNYYLNMDYPLGCPGTGSTCDQQALYDGDMISVHFIEDKMVMGSSFAALVADEDGTYSFGEDPVKATVNKGEEITLTAFHSASDWQKYTTTFVPTTEAEVKYVEKSKFNGNASGWTELGTTDDDGQITIDTDELGAGEYYIAVLGGVDYDASTEREVAMFELTVNGTEEEIIYGDVNGDGEVTAVDAGIAYAIYNEKYPQSLTDTQRTAADVNGDGEITAVDAGLIYAVYNEKLDKFPVEN